MISIVSTTQIAVVQEDGSAYLFNLTGASWLPDADITDKLIELTDASGVRTGWQYTKADNSVENYDAAGQLLSITDRTGLSQTLTYSCTTVSATCPVVTPTTTAPVAGLLIGVTDSFNRSLNFTYNTAGQLAILTDPAGNITRYNYDAKGNLSTVTYPDDTPADLTDNPQKTYVYGELANTANFSQPYALTGIIDENGDRYATYQYSTSSTARAISTEHATGGIDKYSLAYSADGSSTSVTDPLGSVRTTHFTSVLGVVKSTGSDQPAGSGCPASSNAVSYDANGNIASRTDFNGHRTNYTYDLARNLETSRTEGLTAAGAVTPETRTISTDWHPTFRLPVKITEPGLETAWVYDSKGHITQNTLKDTATAQTRAWNTQYTYSATVPGAVLQKVEDGPRTDVADLATTDYYAPDAACTGGHVGCRGEISQITNALGHLTRITAYNAHGQAETLIDPNGLITTLTYDARQRLLSYSIGGEITGFQYDKVGQLTQITRPDTSTLHYSYDAAHRLTQISDSLGNQIVYTLDAMGNRIKEEILDPTGQLVQTRRSEVDALSRLAKDIGADNQTTQYRYDSQGNLTDRIDPLNHTAGYDYDSLNRLLRHTNPANDSSQNSFDGRDNLTAVTDPRGNTTQYIYDGQGNLIREVSPDRGTTDYTVDAAGNVLTRTDARGVKHTYTYDALNRPTRRVHATVAPIPTTANINWTYDQGVNGIGRLTQMADESGNTVYGYDGHGRLLNKTQTTLFNGVSLAHSLAYSYDAIGHLTGQTYPSGLQIAYGYDSQGRISQISLNGQTLLNNLAYQPFGPVQGWTWGTGQPYSRHFDADGRLADYPLGSDTRVVGHDPAGRITAYSHTTAANNRGFDYDPVDRLILDNDSAVSRTYQYDANGNRSSLGQGGTTYQYTTDAASNRLLGSAGPAVKTYSHDAAGHLTGDGVTTFDWNAGGRLARTLTGALSNTYRHTGRGERVIKAGSTITYPPHRYVYDPAGHLIGEYDKNNAVRQETVWLGDLPVAVVKKDPATQQFLIYYVQADHLNTPRVILNAANTPVWRWDTSDAFGAAPANEDPDGDGQKFEYNLRFPGQYYDKETGLHYNTFRDYDPGTGRYIESDPIGLEGGINTYGYVGGNPVNFVDPLGLQSTSEPIRIPLPTIPLPGTGDENTPSPSKDIGELVQGCYDAIDKIFNDETPCDPPEGTICYSSLEEDHSHKGKQPHRHTYQQNRVSSKSCRWNKRRATNHTFGPEDVIPSNMKSCESYSSWVKQYGK